MPFSASFKSALRYAALAVLTLSLTAGGLAGLATAVTDAEVSAVQGNPDATTAWALKRLRLARRLRPDLSEPWRLSALFEESDDETQARAMLLQALRLDATDWRIWQQLSRVDFQLGHEQSAEQDLQKAARYSTGFQVHYDIANVAFLLGDLPMFWQQMKTALLIAPSDKVSSILQDVTLLQGGKPEQLVAILPAGRTMVEAEAVDFLVGINQLPAAEEVWRKMSCRPEQPAACGHSAEVLTDGWLRLAVAGNGPKLAVPAPPLDPAQRALDVWNNSVAAGALAGPGVAVGAVGDPGFLHSWRDSGFLWRKSSQYVQLVRDPSAGNVAQVQLDGYEASYTLLFWQWIVVEPGQNYVFSYDARGDSLPDQGGIQAEISTPDGQLLATVPAGLGATWLPAQGSFSAPPGIRLLRLNFVYRRPFGNELRKGEAWLRSFSLRPTRVRP